MRLLECTHYKDILEFLECSVFKRRLHFPDIIRLHNNDHPDLTLEICNEYLTIQWRPHA